MPCINFVNHVPLLNKLTLIKNYAKPCQDSHAYPLSSFQLMSTLELVEQLPASGPLVSRSVSMKSDAIIEKIRDKLKESDPNKRTVVNTFQFNFTDTDGKLIKSMVFDFKALDIYEGKAPDADGRVTIADDDFYLVGTKQKTFEQMLQEQKATIDGDADALNKMLEKFRINS